MSVIYSQAWYADLKRMINESSKFAKKAPKDTMAMAHEVEGDSESPYVKEADAKHYLLVLDGEKVVDLYGEQGSTEWPSGQPPYGQ